MALANRLRAAWQGISDRKIRGFSERTGRKGGRVRKKNRHTF